MTSKALKTKSFIVTFLAAILLNFGMNCIDFAGTQTDPLAALVFCGPVKPRHVMINGRFVVKDHNLSTLSMVNLLEKHDKSARALLAKRH